MKYHPLTEKIYAVNHGETVGAKIVSIDKVIRQWLEKKADDIVNSGENFGITPHEHLDLTQEQTLEEKFNEICKRDCMAITHPVVKELARAAEEYFKENKK